MLPSILNSTMPTTLRLLSAPWGGVSSIAPGEDAHYETNHRAMQSFN